MDLHSRIVEQGERDDDEEGAADEENNVVEEGTGVSRVHIRVHVPISIHDARFVDSIPQTAPHHGAVEN